MSLTETDRERGRLRLNHSIQLIPYSQVQQGRRKFGSAARLMETGINKNKRGATYMQQIVNCLKILGCGYLTGSRLLATARCRHLFSLSISWRVRRDRKSRGKNPAIQQQQQKKSLATNKQMKKNLLFFFFFSGHHAESCFLSSKGIWETIMNIIFSSLRRGQKSVQE